MSKRHKTIAGNLNDGDDNSNSISDLAVVSNPATETSCRCRRHPPFIEKLNAMVVDPETNDIVSWSSSKQSFIIWDRNRFQFVLLPKYFSHNNFNSFSTQLYLYGFKKINWELYEYANPLFVEGKEELLMGIRRKGYESKGVIAQREDMHVVSLMEPTLEILRSEQMKLEQQIQELRGKQTNLLDELVVIGDSTKATLEDQEHLNSGLIAHLVQKSVIQHLKDHQEKYGTEEPVAEIIHLVSPDNNSSGDCANQEKFGTEEPVTEIIHLVSPDNNSSRDCPDQEDPTIDQTEAEPVTTPPDDSGRSTQGRKISYDDSAFWKMILEDDSFYSGGLVSSST